MSPIDAPNPIPIPIPIRHRAAPRAAASALALLGALLGACTTPKAPPAPVIAPIVLAPPVHCDPPLEPQDLAARHLIATQDRFSSLNTADLVQEASRPVDPASVDATMDQALALSMTRSPGDLAKAQALIETVLHNYAPAADPWRGLARLLAWRLNEQKRAEDAAERNAQQGRDAQRDAQRKLDQLNDKLEALKAIERSLNTRPGATPPAASRSNP